MHELGRNKWFKYFLLRIKYDVALSSFHLIKPKKKKEEMNKKKQIFKTNKGAPRGICSMLIYFVYLHKR